MKTIFRVLVIAAVWCFASVTSSVIRDGKDGQAPATGLSCVQNAMDIYVQASDSVVQLLCAYMNYKDLPDKEEIIQAIQKLQKVSGCTTQDIFGTSESLEKVVLDENGILTNQMIVIEQLLRNRGISWNSVQVFCLLLDNASKGQAGQGNKRTTRHLVPGLLNAILSLPRGLLGGSLGGPLSLLGGLTGQGGLAGGLFGPRGLLGGLLGGPGGLLGGLLDAPLGLLGGLTNLGGLAGGLTGSAGPLGGLIGSGGLLDGLIEPDRLLGGLLGGQGGQGQGSVGLLGGITEGLVGGRQKQGGLGGILSGLTNGLLG